MPLFHRETAEERQQKEAAQLEAAVQERSLRQLEAGGLPVHAEERIAQIRAGKTSLFSSDLSADELLLTRQAGFEPIALVSGSSVYHVGWNSWLQTGELEAQTRAMAGAAYAAIGRLEQEAAGMGAIGVVGVRLAIAKPAWGESLVELTAIGTAIRARDGSQAEKPFVSGLAGQELWSLLRAGVRPCGLVFGNCAYYIYSDWGTQWQNNSWYNQEVGIYSRSLYQAQRAAFGRMHQHARECRANGVIGVHIEHSIEIVERQQGSGDSSTEIKDYVVQYLAWGTAVVEAPTHATIEAPMLSLDLEDVSRMPRVTPGSESR